MSVLLSLPCPARAHGVGVQCKLEGDKLIVEAYFDDNTPASDAKVSILNRSEETVGEGRTDVDGRWICATPGPGVYQVIVDAGGGHLRKIKVNIDGGVVTGDGPTREEFTRVPWLKVILGVGVLGVISFVFWLNRKRPASHSASES